MTNHDRALAPLDDLLTFLILARKQDLICRVKSLGSNESNWKMTFFEIMGHVIPHSKKNLTLILNLASILCVTTLLFRDIQIFSIFRLCGPSPQIGPER